MGAVSNTLYIGVDPGKQGAVAFLLSNRANNKTFAVSLSTPVTVTVTKHPRAKTKSGKPKVTRKSEYNILAMRDIITEWVAKVNKKQKCRVVFCIERQWARPTDSKSNIQRMAEGYASWLTIAKLLGLPIVEISPVSWKPKYVPVGADKKESVKICTKLYPMVSLPKVKDSDRAEAVLIADFVRRRDEQIDYPLDGKKRLVRHDVDKPATRKRKLTFKFIFGR